MEVPLPAVDLPGVVLHTDELAATMDAEATNLDSAAWKLLEQRLLPGAAHLCAPEVICHWLAVLCAMKTRLVATCDKVHLMSSCLSKPATPECLQHMLQGPTKHDCAPMRNQETIPSSAFDEAHVKAL